MAPHFSKHKLDVAFSMAQQESTATEIHCHFLRLPTKKRLAAPDLTTVRRALRGVTHKRSMKETRGPKVKLTPVQVRRLNAARKDLIHKAAGEGEVHIADVMAKAKIDHVSIATVSKHFKKIRSLVEDTSRSAVANEARRGGTRTHLFSLEALSERLLY